MRTPEKRSTRFRIEHKERFSNEAHTLTQILKIIPSDKFLFQSSTRNEKLNWYYTWALFRFGERKSAKEIHIVSVIRSCCCFWVFYAQNAWCSIFLHECDKLRHFSAKKRISNDKQPTMQFFCRGSLWTSFFFSVVCSLFVIQPF